VRRPRLQTSLTVTAVSLMSATVVANALGLVFWAVAAHLKPPEVVGRAAAAIAALTLLATIAQLNLTSVFIRLLPAAGRLGRRLIARGYLAVVGLALVIATVYAVSGLSAGVLTGGWYVRVLFALAVAVLAIFALQDSVLIALRLAPWVTVENVSSAACKLALLPLLGLLPLGAGVVVSWVLPVAFAVIAVNQLLFGRVLPALKAVEGTLPGRRRLLSFVAGEYVGNICATAAVQLMPLLVVWRLGPAQAAYLALPWLISMGITLLLWDVAASFVVEIAGAPERSSALLRRSLLLGAAIVLGALAVCLLGAHPLLGLVGSRYAAQGSALLRLVGLSVPFSAVVALYSTLVWLDQRVWLLAAFQGASTVMVLGMTLALLPRLGLVAVGWANLATQALAATAMAPLALQRLRRGELLEAG
jgi:O-antigen/teichoic acid export membrane protein